MVQGVGFRFTTRRIAAGHPVRGYVKNLPDGRVELVAEGEPEALEAFLAEMADRMSGYIRGVTQESGPATGEFPDFSAIVEPVTKKASERTVTDMRERRGIKVIPLGKPMGIARALRRNEVVLVVGERLIDGDGVEVEFFGERTMFPRGAAYWSARLGTPIVPAFCIRQPDGTYVSYIEAPIRPPADVSGEFDVAGHTQRLASIIESYITRYPEQWCMLQPIWGSAGGRR
jgi:acylphosphatase